LCLLAPAAGRGALEELIYGDKPGLNLSNIRGLVLPFPPIKEQERIIQAVEQLNVLIDRLEARQRTERELAATFAAAAVAAITGTASGDKKRMKAPETEIVSQLKAAPTQAKPAGESEPLARLLSEHTAGLNARALWHRSGFSIDAFYQQLKKEMAAGWIVETSPAEVREVTDD
jgi:type I restriction enzyme S subunit